MVAGKIVSDYSSMTLCGQVDLRVGVRFKLMWNTQCCAQIVGNA